MSDQTEKREKLIKRLRYLWTWELFDSFFLPAIVLAAAKLLDRSVGLFTLYSACLVALILWQGAAYWWIKLRAVENDSEIQAQVLRWFRVFRIVNWILIALLPVILVIQAVQGVSFRSGLDVVAGLGLGVLAVLEQINYYHYQLMYDYPPDWRFLIENKRLRRSSLSRALNRLDARGRTIT